MVPADLDISGFPSSDGINASLPSGNPPNDTMPSGYTVQAGSAPSPELPLPAIPPPPGLSADDTTQQQPEEQDDSQQPGQEAADAGNEGWVMLSYSDEGAIPGKSRPAAWARSPLGPSMGLR